jgi:hypothetical protein
VIRILIILTLLINLNISYASQITKETYFKGSDYELNVYKIKGRLPGKTMLIVGGIQGDEPGGFLSADLYTDIHLEKGNLIVVPRANFKSIILYNRGIDGDMNRRFAKNKKTMEMDKVVEIIKKLMSESDIFLHLHDGWGYHSPKYIDKNRNPKRFGQSVIVDDENFKCENGKILNLKEMALEAIKIANSKIPDKNHHLHFFNTDTSNNHTKFPEMKKTATYYAITHYCIPAFGIEASKNLPTTEMKVLYHNYVVNAFMKMMDIIPEQPKVLLKKPKLKEISININGKSRTLPNNSNIVIPKDSIIKIEKISANYDRGLSCNVLLTKSLNDFNKEIKIDKNTKIIIKKDSIKIGQINIKVDEDLKENDWVFIVKIDNKPKAILNGEIVEIKKGSILKLIKTFNSASCNEDTIINFKGFVPPKVFNNTGDDRGYDILIDGKFMPKYSKNGNGELFPVIAGETQEEKARFWVKIIE